MVTPHLMSPSTGAAAWSPTRSSSDVPRPKQSIVSALISPDSTESNSSLPHLTDTEATSIRTRGRTRKWLQRRRLLSSLAETGVLVLKRLANWLKPGLKSSSEHAIRSKEKQRQKS